MAGVSRRPFWCSVRAEMRACWMRCTQYVHFSITPRDRTVTSGFIIIFSVGLFPYE